VEEKNPDGQLYKTNNVWFSQNIDLTICERKHVYNHVTPEM
jgi:hypothetical protein